MLFSSPPYFLHVPRCAGLYVLKCATAICFHATGSICLQHAGLYALVCATAVLAGVFRSAISLVVLVVEGTRSANSLFGIILAARAHS
jgi:H+/Cl- antiporter ClcA